MKVILLQDVRGTGKKGTVVDVAEGFFRNYLLPRGLAKEASAGGLRALEHEKQTAEARNDRLVQEARRTAERLSKVTVHVSARAGEGGRLFGSVTAQDIADALWSQHKVKLDRRKIELEGNIKSLGLYVVTVHLFKDISAELRVHVSKERKGNEA